MSVAVFEGLETPRERHSDGTKALSRADIARQRVPGEKSEMQGRFLRLSVLAALIAGALSANRTVPEWQGWSRRPLGDTTKCAVGVLGQFGRVAREIGRKPEAGLIRLNLYNSTAPDRSPPILTAYFDGDGGFSSVFMDASDHRKAAAIWSGLRRHCGFSGDG